MTIEDILQEYNFKETEAEIRKRVKKGRLLHPTYEKHLSAAWVIQDIWAHVEHGGLSLGKARELTTSVIEQHLLETVQ